MRLLLCRAGWVGTIAGVSVLVRGNLAAHRATALIGIAITILGAFLLVCAHFVLPKATPGDGAKPQPQ